MNGRAPRLVDPYRRGKVRHKGVNIPTYLKPCHTTDGASAVRHLVIQISDPHLSGARAYNLASWDACVAHANALRPDLVAVTGDLILDNPDDEGDHAFVRAELDRLTSPWTALAGNHDIGDTGPDAHMGQYVSEVRRQRFLAHFGADYWYRDIGDWRLIGLNCLLLGSDLPGEAEQTDWLRATAADAAGRPIALFTHKPVGIDRLHEETTNSWSITAEGQHGLRAALQGTQLRLIASGHAHVYRTIVEDGVAMVWAPSTAQFHGRATRPFGGVGRPGVVHYRFDGEAVEFGLVEPAGVVQVDVADLVATHKSMRFAPPLSAESVRSMTMAG